MIWEEDNHLIDVLDDNPMSCGLNMDCPGNNNHHQDLCCRSLIQYRIGHLVIN